MAGVGHRRDSRQPTHHEGPGACSLFLGVHRPLFPTRQDPTELCQTKALLELEPYMISRIKTWLPWNLFTAPLSSLMW